MIDERKEFEAYTGKVRYEAKSKHDWAWRGRFVFDMLFDFKGFARILTILARGYLFDGGEPDVERARRALCAWCSVPDKKRTVKPKEDWQFETEFSTLHEEFPELVDADGAGWLVRHVRRMCAFAKKHPDVVSKPDASACEKISGGWENEWRKKVVQLQVPIFAPNTRAAWGLRFDDVLADALELGPLRSPDVSFPSDLERRIEEVTPKGVPTDVLRTLIGYYAANRQEDTDWVVLPVVNFDAYFGNNFSHRWLNALPEDVIVRQRDGGRGVCRYRVAEGYKDKQKRYLTTVL
ncbi:MAG: hypothetical protein E7474_09665 [Ruminococcaceae bacterium]|nr:hypothetical protein [Oscillospiraceae bacterium]